MSSIERDGRVLCAQVTLTIETIVANCYDYDSPLFGDLDGQSRLQIDPCRGIFVANPRPRFSTRMREAEQTL